MGRAGPDGTMPLLIQRFALLLLASCTGTMSLGSRWSTQPTTSSASSSEPAAMEAAAPAAAPAAAHDPDIIPELEPLEQKLAEVRSGASGDPACWVDHSMTEAKTELAKVTTESLREEARRRYDETKAIVEATPWIRKCRALAKDREYQRLTKRLAIVFRRHQRNLELFRLPQGERFCDDRPSSEACETENEMISLQTRIQIVQDDYLR